MLRALVLSLCWTRAFGSGSVDAGAIVSSPFTVQSDLLTVGELEIQVRALRAGSSPPPPRSVVEEAMSVFYGYKNVTILDSNVVWASQWSLRPGVTQIFSTRFSATGIADGLRLGGLERALQKYMDAADTGILVEAASVNSLKWVEVGMASMGDPSGASSRHKWSGCYGIVSANSITAAGVAFAFVAACFASALCKGSTEQGDEETGDASETVPRATQPDRDAPVAPEQEPSKPSRAKYRCISNASTAATEGDESWTTVSTFSRRVSSSSGSISTSRSFDDKEYLQCDESDEEYEEDGTSPPRQPHEQDSGTRPARKRVDPSGAEPSCYLLMAETPL